MDRNDFFAKVNVPTFDSNYASSFEQFIETINNNFTRIASLPFLKGDNGSSIIIHKERLYDDRGRFTEFGILLVKAIYKELANRTFTNFDELKNELKRVYIGSEPINDVYSCEQLSPEKVSSIPVYYDQYTGEKHLCVPYIFQDSRKNALQGHYLTSYVDQTKYVIGNSREREEGVFSWKFETSDFIPSLYYDENNSTYCWSINGEKSGITAQGVRGEDGNSSKSWLCIGEISTNYTDYVKINTVFKDTYDSTEISVGESDILEGDLAVVVFSNSEGKNDVLFGPIIVTTGESAIYLVKISGNNLLSIENTNDFHTLMKSAGKSQAGQNDVLGLYTFGRTNELQNHDNEGSSRIPHMFWVDENETTAHIAPVTVCDDLNNPKREHLDIPDTTIKLGYDSLETNNSSISKRNFNKQFDVTNSNYVIVPSTNIKVNDFKNVSMIQKGSLNNIRTAKNIDMSIDLPSLGIKTSSGEIICLDKVRRLIGNDTKPLDISLELTELNCNWKNDDNSSWGGRSYYDVDLFASSATFNENDSQAVYVGTTETPIKATIEGNDYFANLQVSVVRHDVAYDTEGRPLNVRGFYECESNVTDSVTTLESDLVYNSGMLLECIKQVGEEFAHTYEPTDNLKITCKTTVSSIKTFTDVVVYLKPYSNSTTNDLFYLLNSGNTSPEFEHIFWDINRDGVVEPIFETSYYTCFRLRFNDEEDGKIVLSHLKDNGAKPFDIASDLRTNDFENQITINENKVEINNNIFIFNVEDLTNGKLIGFDQEFDCSIPLNTNINNEKSISKITKNFNCENVGDTFYFVKDFSYLNNEGNIVTLSTKDVIVYNVNLTNPNVFNPDFHDELIVYYIELPEDCDVNYYFGTSQNMDRRIYGILSGESSSITLYFFETHLANKNYTIINKLTPIGLNNKYYHILNSSGIPLSITKNTQSLSGLGITGDTNRYSIKFNNFKWNVGTFNTSLVRYNSGIGCGKLLPFPENLPENQNTQHIVLDNSPWYLTLSKNVSNDTLFNNIYTDFVFDKSNNVILSNNYVEKRLPNDVNCYYLGELYLNNEPILTKSITEFEIRELSRDNESNSNTDSPDSPGTEQPPSEVLPELPDNPGINNN